MTRKVLALFSATVVGAVALAGCQNGSESSLEASLDSALGLARSVTADSQAQAIEAAKRALEDAQAEVANVQDPGPALRAKLAAVEGQLARLQATQELQRARADVEQKVAAARDMKEDTSRKIADAKAKLEQAERDFRKMQSDVEGAKAQWDAFRSKLESFGSGS